MKKLFKFISAVCILALLSGCSMIGESDKAIQKKKEQNAVVTVNGTALSKERFNYYFYNEQDELLKSAGITNASEITDNFWDTETDGKTYLELAKENALSNLINDELQYQKALEEDIELTKQERSNIDAQLGQLKQNQQFIAQLEQVGVSADTYEELYTESMYIQKLIAKYINEGKLNVDKNEAINTFKTTYVKAKHILFLTQNQSTGENLSDAEIAEKEKKANEVLAQIRSGADFDALMKEYCEDPGVQSNPDGYVFTTGQMVKEFEETAFALGENEVSGLVKTDYGYHIIKKLPLDLEAEQEKQYLDNIEYNLAVPELNKLAKEWKSKAEIKTHKKVLDSIKPSIVNNN